jgi:hypothetical protein
MLKYIMKAISLWMSTGNNVAVSFRTVLNNFIIIPCRGVRVTKVTGSSSDDWI